MEINQFIHHLTEKCGRSEELSWKEEQEYILHISGILILFYLFTNFWGKLLFFGELPTNGLQLIDNYAKKKEV